MYTRLGDKFKQWVDARVDKRHEEVKKDGQKYIELDAEVAQLFQASKAISTSNGVAYHMFKASAKRRRSKQQIKDDKLQEEARQFEIE